MDDNPSPDNSLGGIATNYKLTYLASVSTKWVSHEVGRAHWWLPSKDAHQTANVRHLEGEIHLSPSLHPNCDIPLFQIEVHSFRLFLLKASLIHLIVRC